MKINATKWITLCGAFLALAVLSSPAQATSLGGPLAVGGTVGPPVPSVILPAGTIVSNLGVVNTAAFTNGGSFMGTLTYAVWRETGTGSLDFLFQVKDNAGSTDNIGRVTMSNFAGFTTSVSYAALVMTAAGGTAPVTSLGFAIGTAFAATADRPVAATVGWNYGTTLGPGVTSGLMVICTNATNFTAGTVAYLNRAPASSAGYAPSTQGIPEPRSFVLFGCCFLGLVGAYAWRRWQGMPISP